MTDHLEVDLVHPYAQAPVRGTPGSVGYDLRACVSLEIQPGTRRLVDTGIRVRMPSGVYGRIAPRSGLSVRGVDVGAGVIDPDYRDVLKVLLVNNGTDVLDVKVGDRIAQLVLERVATPLVRVVQGISETETERGIGGFGSTGR